MKYQTRHYLNRFDTFGPEPEVHLHDNVHEEPPSLSTNVEPEVNVGGRYTLYEGYTERS